MATSSTPLGGRRSRVAVCHVCIKACDAQLRGFSITFQTRNKRQLAAAYYRFKVRVTSASSATSLFRSSTVVANGLSVLGEKNEEASLMSGIFAGTFRVPVFNAGVWGKVQPESSGDLARPE